MSHLNRFAYIEVDEYLARESQASIRHEYVDGHVYAMTGSTRKHNIISGNLHSLVRFAASGSGVLNSTLAGVASTIVQ